MSIISGQGTHANANHAVFQNNANNLNGITDAINADRDELERMKASVSFTRLMGMDGVKFTYSGTHPRCLCPFHSESTPSFSVYNDSHGHCFGCGWHGDVIDYLKKRFDTDFPTAKVLLEDLATTGKVRRKGSLAPTPVPIPPVEEGFSPSQADEAIQMTQTLRSNPKLCRQIALSRNWKPETIELLARSQDLGWFNNSIAFIYETGIKLRLWPWNRDFRWYCGKPSLWRRDTIKDAKEIYLTEGETDAISLIDAGKSTGERTVIAAPSATTFNAAWAPAFTGKIVTLCFDNDEAGQRAVQKVAGLLAPFAAEIFTIDWKEISHV